MVLVMARHEAGPVSQWLLKDCILSSKSQGDYQALIHWIDVEMKRWMDRGIDEGMDGVMDRTIRL